MKKKKFALISVSFVPSVNPFHYHYLYNQLLHHTLDAKITERLIIVGLCLKSTAYINNTHINLLIY